MKAFETIIRENQIDVMGHLNNATYLELFEAARWDVLIDKGYTLQKIKELGQGPVILEVNLKFLKEVKARDTLKITTEVLDYKGKIGHMKQTMLKQDGGIASEAILVFGLFDTKKRQLIEPTEAWLQVLVND
ncbi:MAG: acyl-CoA thioesterase [Bdellovibrionales bacterium]|nr:acyl-CoA thioesterase [Bdellovibrionales bacterium]